mmetsp:Transcript_11921/g.34812  ORF Transcript_11921/g.34812 Transcript_11921/m.34812 type:complete len:238 (+) Transcript_11921:752-1465(+)
MQRTIATTYAWASSSSLGRSFAKIWWWPSSILLMCVGVFAPCCNRARRKSSTTAARGQGSAGTSPNSSSASCFVVPSAFASGAWASSAAPPARSSSCLTSSFTCKVPGSATLSDAFGSATDNSMEGSATNGSMNCTASLDSSNPVRGSTSPSFPAGSPFASSRTTSGACSEASPVRCLFGLASPVFASTSSGPRLAFWSSARATSTPGTAGAQGPPSGLASSSFCSSLGIDFSSLWQ